MSPLPATALLVLSVLFVRPADGRGATLRLIGHALLLAIVLAAGCIGTMQAAQRPVLLMGMFAALAQAGVAWRVSRSEPGGLSPETGGTTGSVGRHGMLLVWIAALLLVGLSLLVVPDRVLPGGFRGMLQCGTAILLLGILGAAVASSRGGRLCALLLGGDGLMMLAGISGGGLALASIVSIQAALLWSLMQAASSVRDAP